MPRKTRAFDAGGEFAHAGEDFQSAQVVLFGFGVEVAFGHPVEFVEHPPAVRRILAEYGAGETLKPWRRKSRRNRPKRRKR